MIKRPTSALEAAAVFAAALIPAALGWWLLYCFLLGYGLSRLLDSLDLMPDVPWIDRIKQRLVLAYSRVKSHNQSHKHGRH